MARAKRIKCPGCEENFELESDLEIGDTTVCPNCFAELKIIELDPPILKVSEDKDAGYDAEEDSDDEDDYADDEEDVDDIDDEDNESKF